MVAIDLRLADSATRASGRTLRLAMAGIAFWLCTSVFFTILAAIDQIGRGYPPSPPFGVAGFLYGYASWIVLAPVIFVLARRASALSGLALYQRAGLLCTGMYAFVLSYCVVTQFAVHGLGPVRAISQYGVFEWLWDGFLFGLVFLSGLRSGSLTRSESDVTAAPRDRLAVRSPDRVDYIEIDDIQAVTAQGNYAALMLEDGTILHRETLASLARRLESAGFVRIHRSHIIHPDQVVSAAARGDRIREARLKNGSRFPVSASFSAQLALRLHGQRKS